VRALGALLLLVAGPVLTAAFLQPQASRLLLPILAYAWIIVGMYFIGMPFLMRNWTSWIVAKPPALEAGHVCRDRLRRAAAGGGGVVLLTREAAS